MAVGREQHGPLPPGSERERFLAQQPTYWLKRCYQSLRRRVDQELRQFGLTLSQRDVLLALYEEGPLDQRTLCDCLGLEQSSVSRLVDGLVKRELVTLRSGLDRRVRIAALSASGTLLLQQTPGASELAGGIMIGGLDQAERQQLLRFLRHCTDNLNGNQKRPEKETSDDTQD